MQSFSSFYDICLFSLLHRFLLFPLFFLIVLSPPPLFFFSISVFFFFFSFSPPLSCFPIHLICVPMPNRLSLCLHKPASFTISFGSLTFYARKTHNTERETISFAHKKIDEMKINEKIKYARITCSTCIKSFVSMNLSKLFCWNVRNG